VNPAQIAKRRSRAQPRAVTNRTKRRRTMSTPSPATITLPTGKTFEVVIHSSNYSDKNPGELSFIKDPVSLEWTASYSVPSVELTELDCPVTQPGRQIEFMFELKDVTREQEQAGYVVGPYTFTFDPPGGGASEFTGQVNDPRPDQAEDTFTARGNEADPKY